MIVRQSVPTYFRACVVTGIDPLPPSGEYDPGELCRAILRRLFPGLVLGYVAVVAGVWRLLSTFLNPRFKRTHIVFNIVTLAVIAVFVVNGLKTCLVGPSWRIRSFGETARQASHAIGAEAAPQHEH